MSATIRINFEKENADIEKPEIFLPTESFSIIESLESTLNHLNTLYGDTLSQSRRSFEISLWCSLGGFIILAGLVFYYLISNSVANWIVFLSGLSSIILQITGGTLFILHARSNRQMYYFGEGMTKIYESLIADYIAGGITNEAKKDDTKAQIAIETASRKLTVTTETNNIKQ